MKELIKKHVAFTRIEFWALTAIFAFVIFFFIADAFQSDTPPFKGVPYIAYFEEAKMPFHFYRNYFFPQLINHILQAILVMFLNFIVIPGLLLKENLRLHIFLLVLAFVLGGIVFGVSNTHLREYLYAGSARDSIDQEMFWNGFQYVLNLFLLVAIYTAIKYAGIYLLAISGKIEAKYNFIRKEAIVAAVIWIAGILFLHLSRAEREFSVGWTIVVPSAIALYLFSFHKLIPRALARKRYQFISYVLTTMLILFSAFFLIFVVAGWLVGDDDAAAGYSAFNSFFQLFITMPVTWALYRKYLRGNDEVRVLQKELGKSNAKLDFLRSQINPHFLFNALNTLYGTAIQENADRTSEGIQKLGDMMRFMLQENMQETISLAREIDYLNNYISLQRLRIDANPVVQITTDIQDRENSFQIAPMLLIPFVENAFKHGISFREASHIKVALEIKNTTLNFDVYNSKHTKTSNDPEKDKSGIGLENVKERLKLLYPGKHELSIRDTSKEFFVHLSIQLAKYF